MSSSFPKQSMSRNWDFKLAEKTLAHKRSTRVIGKINTLKLKFDSQLIFN
jgi:hypothetical protein